MFDVIGIPALKDNYIWLLRKGRSAVVVDPGDAAPVLAVLARDGLQLTSILVTHHHADHQGGIDGLLARFPATVFGPGAESITALGQPLSGGEVIELPENGTRFSVIPVPGHTSGHLAYYGADCLFCGDTLFGGGCGRLFEGTADQMYQSLQQLSALPDDTAVYCAHEYTQANLRFARVVEPGNQALLRRADEVDAARAKGLATVPSTIGIERATNPFLRCDQPDVIAAAQARVPDVKTPPAVFAALRKWKDNF